MGGGNIWTFDFVLTFNSLSRDHLRPALQQDEAADGPFNSLSRDHVPQPVVDLGLLGDPFNSLSRDHALMLDTDTLTAAKNFQLPLSGSPIG